MKQKRASVNSHKSHRNGGSSNRAEEIRLATEEVKDEQRLLERVSHLRAVLAWAEAMRCTEGPSAAVPAGATPPTTRSHLQACRSDSMD